MRNERGELLIKRGETVEWWSEYFKGLLKIGDLVMKVFGNCSGITYKVRN